MRGFNEATTARSWNFRNLGGKVAIQDGFNEATTARSWNCPGRKSADANPHASMRPRPRGRGIHKPGLKDTGKNTASMRPRPRGRGILDDYWDAERLQSFNEATTARSWNSCHHAPRTIDQTRFNEATTARSWNWGDRVGLVRQVRASMRPRPRGRGIHRDRWQIKPHVYASMRPRPRGRGIFAGIDSPTPASMLQ